jgi:FkbM family methyltransferase
MEALAMLGSHLGRRLTLVDVGARWGVSDCWDGLEEAGQFVCFEPDREECDRLNAVGRPHTRYYPYALSERDGELDITLTREPACSSAYLPLPGLYECYPALEETTPVATRTVPCRRLDSLAPEIGLKQVDAFKVDTQGSELDILKGAIPLLTGCSFVDIEVEFNELYGGANLFHEVDAFLRDQGFVLWRLSELVHYRLGTVPDTSNHLRIVHDPGKDMDLTVSNGQLFWGQAHYVRREFPRYSQAQIPTETAVPAAFICGLYGYWDLALEIIRKSGADTLAADLATVLDRYVCDVDPGEPDRTEDMSEIKDDVQRLQSTLADQERELAERDSRIASLLGSRSWRLTVPLRMVGNLLTSLKKRKI